MAEIKTFMSPATDIYTKKRAVKTLKFISKHIYGRASTCLDIGEKNMVGNYISAQLDLAYYNTVGDLDYNFKAPDDKFDIVICLEVMEHLMSPKFFLLELKKYINKDTQLFFSYPSRPKFLWTSQHFHEYDKKRFIYLLNECGLTVIDWKKAYITSKFIKRFSGVRPFLRQFVNFDNMIYAKLQTKNK